MSELVLPPVLDYPERRFPRETVLDRAATAIGSVWRAARTHRRGAGFARLLPLDRACGDAVARAG